MPYIIILLIKTKAKQNTFLYPFRKISNKLRSTKPMKNNVDLTIKYLQYLEKFKHTIRPTY